MQTQSSHQAVVVGKSLRPVVDCDVIRWSIDLAISTFFALVVFGFSGSPISLPSALGGDHLSARVRIAGVDHAPFTRAHPLPAAPFQCPRSPATLELGSAETDTPCPYVGLTVLWTVSLLRESGSSR